MVEEMTRREVDRIISRVTPEDAPYDQIMTEMDAVLTHPDRPRSSLDWRGVLRVVARRSEHEEVRVHLADAIDRLMVRDLPTGEPLGTLLREVREHLGTLHPEPMYVPRHKSLVGRLDKILG